MGVANELVAITIASHNDDLETNFNSLIGDGGNHVICLEARKFTNRNAHGRE